MSKLTLNTTQIASLIAARTDRYAKSAKKVAWAAIRSAFGITSAVRKLGAEIDETGDPNFGAVYDKDTRKFLLVSPITGRFAGLSDETKPLPGAAPAPAPVADAPAPVADAPAPVADAPAPVADAPIVDVPVDSDPTMTPAVAAVLGVAGFTVISTPAQPMVYKVCKDDLLDILRDSLEASHVDDTAGLPPFGADDIVVDNATGDVYFRQ